MIRASRFPLALILPVAVLASGSGCVDIAAGTNRLVERVEKRFPASGVPVLTLDTFDGGIRVDAWDRPEVLVVVEKYAMTQEAADSMEVTALQDGDRIDVRVRGERPDTTMGSYSARLIVTVPTRADVRASSGDGRISVQDVQGGLTLRTGDGSIELDRVAGAVDARSGDGRIAIDGVLRLLRLESGDGRVVVRASAGSLPTGEWDISTGDGSVVLELPDGFNAELDASTGDGRVAVTDVPFSGAASRGHRAAGRIGSGGPTVRIRSGDGSISVRSVTGQ